MIISEMYIIGTVILAVATAGSKVCNTSIGWCQMSTIDGHIPYSTETHSCVKCGGMFTLRDRKEVQMLRCCENTTLALSCEENESRCEDGGYFNIAHKCDGRKNCVDGSDESICPECSDRFLCSSNDSEHEEQCVDRTKVCDGRKDCFNGLDETNCTYYGGRCDGFRCAKEQCLPTSVICDGEKDCLDGSDESTCLNLKVKDDFECILTGQELSTIPLDKVCDGTPQCVSGEDEKNCFLWSQWSEWSACDCDSNQRFKQTVKRTRCCTTLHSNVNTDHECSGETEQIKNTGCDCEETSTSNPATNLNLPVIIMIPLTIILLLVAMLFAMHLVLRRRKAWLSYSASVSFTKHANPDSTRSPAATDLLNYSEGNDPSSAVFFEGRRLPATPGIFSPRVNTDRLPHTYSSLKFNGRLSFHDNHEEIPGTSGSSPKSPTNKTVKNPLYHSYSDNPIGYQSANKEGNICGPSSTASYQSCNLPSNGSGDWSDIEYPEVFHEDEEEASYPRSSLMEQIEIAQMGNLIEVTDIKIN